MTAINTNIKITSEFPCFTRVLFFVRKEEKEKMTPCLTVWEKKSNQIEKDSVIARRPATIGKQRARAENARGQNREQEKQGGSGNAPAMALFFLKRCGNPALLYYRCKNTQLGFNPIEE